MGPGAGPGPDACPDTLTGYPQGLACKRTSEKRLSTERQDGWGFFKGPLEVVTQTRADHVHARIVIEMHELAVQVQLVEQVHGGADSAEGIRG